MSLIAQPWRHPVSGVYYIRRFVPFALRPIIGKVEIRRSLRTSDFRQAKALFAEAYTATERLFAEARSTGSVNVTGVKSLAPEGPQELHGRPIASEASPTYSLAQNTQQTLSQALQGYVASLALIAKPDHVKANHEAQLRKVVERFIETFGDLPVSGITSAMIQTFAVELATVPVIGGRKAKSATIQDLKRLAKPDTPTLSTATIRLSIARLSSLLSFVVESGAIPFNPVIKSRVLRRLDAAKPKKSLDDDKGYTWGEMISMFSRPEFAAIQNADGRPGNAVFWLPILAAYTGARREELAQLYVGDIRQDSSGQWFMRIHDSRPDQSVKTNGSRRDIPIHDDLIELGLLTLVIGKSPSALIFPQLTKVSGRYSGIVAKHWLALVRNWGTYRSGRHPLHAFRHTWKTLAREHGIPKEVSDWITGHASGSVGDSYGINPLSRMAAEMKKLPSIARAAGLLPIP
ncbi:site-specific integrase [Pseudomonas aeruginosa]|uniref:Site-specific integrase n=1 Tax=Pseudomonas aeruginosa TaxID=287 RepID=A0A643JCS9_PSEAI|nr:site-specific integrase [Pseudomonas aeruginosa]EKV4467477.1 site-specific integrase [Pseudomonas aeruginosa]ELQ7869608.1 site-specific integrase [Pseudomonas aeruginosa]KAB0768492.1 site-specific integrase [Pseudomonas aeruginosa]MBH8938577.1 site-specific integrase [Pseudomonas aeruginosa]MCW5394429.1 site-specific integrase [Pseudomonas aeruginosa]